MNWLVAFFSSSIGKKVIMSLTGLFLIVFLVVHLVGNLQLLKGDEGEAFNLYTLFMTTNPLIKMISYGLYFFILLHAIMGIVLYFANRKTKGKGYKVVTSENAGFASKNMTLFGTLVLAFLFIHMGDFWFKMKMDQIQYANYDGIAVKDLYHQVSVTFSKPIFVGIYIIGLITLSFHLWHGFQSAFQTLGINHKQYTPLIRTIGKMYSIIIPLGFAIIPIYMYLKMN